MAGKPKVSVGYNESLQRFAHAVRGNQPALVGCTGEEGLKIAVMVSAAARSLRERRRVVFEDDWFKPETGASPDA